MMSAKRIQRLLNDCFAHFDLPLRVQEDGYRGPDTQRKTVLAKLALGWKPKYATAKRTPALYLALRTFGKSMLPVQRKRGLAWRQDYRHGNSAAAIARRIANHHNARFLFWSPTGGTARAGFLQIAAGQLPYVAATRERATSVSLPLLRFIEALLDEAHGPVLLNCYVNGRHHDGSLHYEAHAIDIDRSSDPHALAVIERVAAENGVHVLHEDAAHDHCYDGIHP